MPTLVVGQVGAAHCLPGAFVCREWMSPFPGAVSGGFAAGVGQLNAHRSWTVLTAKINDAFQSRFIGVRVQPEAFWRNALPGLHSRRFRNHQPGSGEG